MEESKKKAWRKNEKGNARLTETRERNAAAPALRFQIVRLPPSCFTLRALCERKFACLKPAMPRQITVKKSLRVSHGFIVSNMMNFVSALVLALALPAARNDCGAPPTTPPPHSPPTP